MSPSVKFPVLRGADSQQTRVQDNITHVLTPYTTALAATPIMGTPPPPWIVPTLLNGFSNATGTLASTVAYHKDCLGYVHIKGRALHVAGTGALTILFELPSGYRPAQTRLFAVAGGATHAEVAIIPSGSVTVTMAVAAGLSIYPEISFLAEQ